MAQAKQFSPANTQQQLAPFRGTLLLYAVFGICLACWHRVSLALFTSLSLGKVVCVCLCVCVCRGLVACRFVGQ